MINDTTNIDAFISSSRIHGIHFDVLRATFNSNSKANLDQLGNLLKEDNLSFVIKRSFLWKWELIIETPIDIDNIQYINNITPIP